MKHLILFFPILFFIACSSNSNKQTQFIQSKDFIKLIVTDNTTDHQLDSISKELKSHSNIDLDYSQSKFSEEGKLTSLMLDINCNDGNKGSVTLTSSQIKQGNLGFLRDYRKGAKWPFKIGKI